MVLVESLAVKNDADATKAIYAAYKRFFEGA